MNDRFKFRAWNGKEMIIPRTNCGNAEFFFGFNSDGLEASKYIGKGAWKIYPLMQSTGLKDKSGELIFEGDIVKIYYGFGYERKSGAVYEIAYSTFMGGAFVLKNKYGESYIDYHDTSLEIIGNIYENPDLLK